jgi:hypothetical protein
MIPVSLPNVTMIIVDTVAYGDAVNAVLQSWKQIKPARTIMFTDIELNIHGIEVINIPHIHSKKEYSAWMMKELGKQPIDTSHILVIQADGYVLKGECWDDEWLKLDYIGSPWLEIDAQNMGNGGFSLRSVALHVALSRDEFIKPLHPEDNAIGRVYRDYLEQTYDITFATDEQGDRFAFELRQPKDYTFGFHAHFHAPYKEPIVIRRKGALGDVLQVSPVLEYFYKKGHPVVLDSDFYQPFARHYFPVINYHNFDHSRVKHRVISLDNSYEMKPRQLHLKSYFEMCGISDYELSNPRLHYQIQESTRLFNQKYCVIHIDERETKHRDVHGVDWYQINGYLKSKGILAVQVGRNSKIKIGVQFNTVNEPLLAWLLKGCEFMLAIDSGPSNMAVALDKKCIIFFGSVNPEYIYHDLTNIIPLQSQCPIGTQHCWHSVEGQRGVDCAVNNLLPPCTQIETKTVMDAIDQILR